jgi:hypothetical protein
METSMKLIQTKQDLYNKRRSSRSTLPHAADYRPDLGDCHAGDLDVRRTMSLSQESSQAKDHFPHPHAHKAAHMQRYSLDYTNKPPQ